MEVAYRTGDGKFTFKVNGESSKELFKAIAGIQEVFEAETVCGVCKGRDIRFQHRRAQDKYDYYELVCRTVDQSSGRTCNARFQFGQSMDTKDLFPKRKDKDGNWIPNRGWVRYSASQQQQSAPVDDLDEVPF